MASSLLQPSNLAALHDGIDIALRLRLVDAVLGDDLGNEIVRALECVELLLGELAHLELISLSRICLASAGLTVFGVTGFTSVISKILMKHHLNVHHSNNTLYVGMNCANHSGEAIIV